MTTQPSWRRRLVRGSSKSAERGIGRWISLRLPGVGEPSDGGQRGQGAVNPSVGTLLRLSDALGVGLPALVEPPEPKPLKITRSGEGAELWSGAAGGRGVLVAGTTPPDVVELWDWTLGPGDRHASEAHAAGTKELVHVLEGAITVETRTTS